MKRWSCLALALVLASCDAADPCDGAVDLATSPEGLVLTAEEHAAGWGRTTCFQCHQAWALHREICGSWTDSGAAIDLAAIDAQVDPSDTSSCVPCHGSNGVAAWQQLEEEAP